MILLFQQYLTNILNFSTISIKVGEIYEKNTNQSNFKEYNNYYCYCSHFLFIGKVWPSGEEPTEITSDLLSQQIQSISELASVEYNYTNMGKYENQATFYGWKVPFTTKSFILSYDGKIKAGIDMSLVEVNVHGQNIDITIPQAKILSHEIDQESIEVFDETKNIFNQISITDYNQFAIDQKER